MSNTITIELCAEDRARLDKLTAALEKRSCDGCVNSALAWAEQIVKGQVPAPEKATEPDEVQKALAETLAKAEGTVEAPKNAPEEAEVSTPTTAPQNEEEPKKEEPTEPQPTKTVDRAELRAKVIELSAKGFKEQVKEIVRAYAQTVTDVPEDKITECYGRLEALEGQG